MKLLPENYSALTLQHKYSFNSQNIQANQASDQV